MRLMKSMTATLAAGLILSGSCDKTVSTDSIDRIAMHDTAVWEYTGNSYIEVLHHIRMEEYRRAEMILQGYMRDQMYQMLRYRHTIDQSDRISEEARVSVRTRMDSHVDRLKDYIWE
jgi:hypothetical protein